MLHRVNAHVNARVPLIAGSHGASLTSGIAGGARSGGPRSGSRRRAGQGHWHGCDWLVKNCDKILKTAKKSRDDMFTCNWCPSQIFTQPPPFYVSYSSGPYTLVAGTGGRGAFACSTTEGRCAHAGFPTLITNAARFHWLAAAKLVRVLPCLSVGRGIDTKSFFFLFINLVLVLFSRSRHHYHVLLASRRVRNKCVFLR